MSQTDENTPAPESPGAQDTQVTSSAAAPEALDAAASAQPSMSGSAEAASNAAPADAVAEAAADASGKAAPEAAGTPDMSPASCAEQLAARFPGLFGMGVFKPIKLRIQADIQLRAPGVFTRKALSIVLHRHTTSTAYLKALATAEHRFDLDGQPAGEIASEHRDAAQAEVERRRAIVQARIQAERAARRSPRPGPSAVADAGVGDSAVPAAPAAPDGQRPPRQGPRREVGGRDARHDVRRDPRGDARGDSRPRRGERPPQVGERGGRPGAQAQQAQRPPRPHDGPRPARAAQPPLMQTHSADAGTDAAALDTRPPPTPRTPEEAAAFEARRQRAMLLRAWEGSPLSKANFCALKGLTEAALDAQIALAQTERGSDTRPPGRPAR